MSGIKKIIYRKLKSILWGLYKFYYPFYKSIQFEKINQIKFNSVGRNFSLGKDYIVKNPKYITIGNNFSALDRFRIEAWDEYQGEPYNPEIIIGENVCFNTDIHIGCIDRIEVGDNCLFGSRIYITDHDHGSTSLEDMLLPPAQRRLYSKGPVIIERNVYVGEGVAILSGVRIGENSIIATNSVVTKDIPKDSVFGGIPARLIKQISQSDISKI